MTNQKKYYWLKLNEDFFGQTLVKKLRKIAGGDTYVIIYLKMQLLGLHSEGKFAYEGIGDTFIEELALKLDEEEENIKVTLMYLEKSGVIELLEENEYFMPSVIESTGSASTVAERVKKHRENKKTVLLSSNEISDVTDRTVYNIEETPYPIDVTPCNVDVTKCNTEIREKKKEKNKKEKSGEGELFEIYCFSQALKDTIKAWLVYKQERKEAYKPEGLRGFFSKVQKNQEAYGENAVISVIEDSISNNWQGVVWTNLNRYPSTHFQPQEPPKEDTYLTDLKRFAGWEERGG